MNKNGDSICALTHFNDDDVNRLQGSETVCDEESFDNIISYIRDFMQPNCSFNIKKISFWNRFL